MPGKTDKTMNNPHEREELEESATLLRASRTHRFDEAGFRAGRPLRRSVFYAEPYLTCRRCNHLFFLNAQHLRLLDVLYAQGEVESAASSRFQASLPRDLLPPSEVTLPPCRVCGAVDGYVAGAHDFSNDIEEDKRLRLERIKRENAAATRLALWYRQRLFRLYGRAVTGAMLAVRKLQHVAAVRINALARGRLARRRAQTERNIAVIRSCHPLLIRHALRSIAGRPKTFWYRRQVEIDLLFANYLDLVEKTGFNPPRIIVERNLQELATRIIKRKNELIVFVQKLWRGFMSRRIVKYYQTELFRLFGLSVARVLRIQCVYRGHAARLRVRKLQAERRNEQRRKDYLRESRDATLTRNRLAVKEKMLRDYRRERAEEFTARSIGKLPFALERQRDDETDGLVSANKLIVKKSSTTLANSAAMPFKMRIFQESILGDDRVARGAQEMLRRDRALLDVTQQYIIDDIVRREFIHFRIAERGPLGYGLRSGPISVRAGLAEAQALQLARERFDWRKPAKTSSAPVRDCSRSRSMRLYFLQELEAIAARAIERIDKTAKDNTVVNNARLDENDSIFTTDSSNKKVKKVTKEFRSYNRERLGLPPLATEEKSQSTKRAPSSSSSRHDNISETKTSFRRFVASGSMNEESEDNLCDDTIFSGNEWEDDEDAIFVEDDGIEEIYKETLLLTSGSIKKSTNTSFTSGKYSRKGTAKLSSSGKLKANIKQTATNSSNTKPAHGSKLRKNYAFPKDLSFDAMAWLYSDDYDND